MLLDGSDVVAVFKQMCCAKLSVLCLDRLTVLAPLYSYFIYNLEEDAMTHWLKVVVAVVCLWVSPAIVHAQSLPLLNMGYSGAGIGSDLLKVIDRSGLWRKHGLEVKVVYLSSGTLMAQTLSSGDIGIEGFDTPAAINLALAGTSLKIVAVIINRLEPLFVVRSNIKTPADLKGKKITISRFGSGSDIISRVALRYWKLDPDKDVSFFQSGNTPTRVAALIAGHMDAALVSSTGVAKILATGCCRVLADLSELPLEYANYSVVVSGSLLKNQRENVRRFLQAMTEGIYVFKTKPDVAKAVLKESNNEAEVGSLYERLTKSFREYPLPEPRGIQNVIEFMPTPKARGARAEDFMDTSLIEEIKKSGFIDRLYGGKG
jgi:ABC-type nitrate/sulfonate/bicarbonate transport system substrate-binding protein